MRIVISVLAVETLLLSSAAATEPVIFHTARFQDHTIVNLSLVESQAAASTDYDYDVLISLSQTSDDIGAGYNDPGKHEASVRCGPPPAVSVRGVDYPIPTAEVGGSDWKDDLWRIVCTPPVS